MVMPFFVDMPMLKFFLIRLAQLDNLHIKAQFIPRQRMVEI